MKTILVWYLVTIGGYNSNQVTYSPPLDTEQQCQFLKKNTIIRDTYRSQCVQLRVVVDGGVK